MNGKRGRGRGREDGGRREGKARRGKEAGKERVGTTARVEHGARVEEMIGREVRREGGRKVGGRNGCKEANKVLEGGKTERRRE